MEDFRFPVGRFVPPSEFNQAVRGELISQIDDTPAALRDAVRRLTAEQLQTPYREGGWTLAQVVHHLPDSHSHAYIRFRLALTESEPTITPYNEAKWAELTDAASSDIESSLLMLEGIHQRWVSLLPAAHAGPVDARVRRTRRGVVSRSRTRSSLYAWHGRHHLAHITGLRLRMGW